MPPDDWDLAAGDLVLVQLAPIRGSEQDGLRPALVVSAAQMHAFSRRAIVCPITRNPNPWPTKVFLPEGLAAEGAVLCDQIRAIDRRERILRKLGPAPPETLSLVRAKIAALLAIDID
ncbi:type II toxin-antitoxin system PemK/MazF family toxin [Enterovirga sp.]|uniref:type II toxin-antitoxin system PemK/MazF family toxin n=1 Tax=Enterovirga sp. TaxID=2026350 RepID=UPI002CD57E3B|nr:type II toxin-antitoxin system PemK/MazF family toxin [Enterovirga sp.]HMO31195.1 type II toxin-antitoxin system PemK/MazF family toxin [Enterovirga sp.]